VPLSRDTFSTLSFSPDAAAAADAAIAMYSIKQDRLRNCITVCLAKRATLLGDGITKSSGRLSFAQQT
jgi:hypothetical protein